VTEEVKENISDIETLKSKVDTCLNDTSTLTQEFESVASQSTSQFSLIITNTHFRTKILASKSEVLKISTEWNSLKEKLKPPIVVKKVVVRKAIKGDNVDELWVKHLNKH